MLRYGISLCAPLLAVSSLIAGELKESANTFIADYVIIGSGPAGAPIAKMLTDDKSRSVILLEAGSNNTENKRIRLSSHIQDTVFHQNARYFWLDETITQSNLGRSFDYISGRTLGGASSVNGTFWIRTSDEKLALWKDFGGKKWSLKRLHRIMKKLEDYHGDTEHPIFRGRKGPVDVRQTAQKAPQGVKFATAFQQALGLPILTDYNDPKTPIGVDERVQWSQRGKSGKYRVSAATAFLNDRIMSKNGKGVHGRKLRVLTKSTALRTIWKGKRAIGVEVLRDGKFTKVYARKEVIISAGINSSQFLQLSGVGPKELLKKYDIPVKFNNVHVGKNLVDHVAVVTVFTANPADKAPDPNSPAEVLGFLPSPSGMHPTHRAIQLVGAPQPSAIGGTPTPNTFAVGVVLCNPKSRGSIQIQSKDPLHMPLVNLAVLENESDLRTLVGAFQDYVLPISEKLSLIDPAYQLLIPSAVVIDDDDLLTEYIKSAVDLPSTVHNYSGHCKMAPLHEGGVVDGAGRVHGVKGLRVADCSIAPIPTDGAGMALAYLIGANIAEQIIDEHK